MAKLLKQKFYKKEELLLDLKTINRLRKDYDKELSTIDFEYFKNWKLSDKIKL